MKKTLSILFSALVLNLYPNTCEDLKKEIVFQLKTSTTSEKTNELIEGLSVCGFDKYDIAIISNPEFFRHAIDELKDSSKNDISLGDLSNYLIEFKNSENDSYKEYYSQSKQFIDFHNSELSSKSLEKLISDWSKLNGEEMALELKDYLIKNKLVDTKRSVNFALNDFYTSVYGFVPFEKNLNSISWNGHESAPNWMEIDKKYYKKRIKIRAQKVESKIILILELAPEWNIYSVEKDSKNIFKSTIVSQNKCLNTTAIKVSNEILSPDPMGLKGEVKVISGNSEIEIPIIGNCSEPLKIEFTFSLMKSDGSSLPFVKEIIEIE